MQFNDDPTNSNDNFEDEKEEENEMEGFHLVNDEEENPDKDNSEDE